MMTNAEKYLKEGISVDEFLTEVIEHCSRSSKNSIETFLNDNSKPTLTEDERVILRNIDKKYKYIGRTDYDAKIQYLYVNVEDGWKPHTMKEFDNLFQFIKERRRI